MNPLHGPGAPKDELPALLMILLILAFLGWVAGQILLEGEQSAPSPATLHGAVQNADRVN